MTVVQAATAAPAMPGAPDSTAQPAKPDGHASFGRTLKQALHRDHTVRRVGHHADSGKSRGAEDAGPTEAAVEPTLPDAPAVMGETPAEVVVAKPARAAESGSLEAAALAASAAPATVVQAKDVAPELPAMVLLATPGGTAVEDATVVTEGGEHPPAIPARTATTYHAGATAGAADQVATPRSAGTARIRAANLPANEQTAVHEELGATNPGVARTRETATPLREQPVDASRAAADEPSPDTAAREQGRVRGTAEHGATSETTSGVRNDGGAAGPVVRPAVRRARGARAQEGSEPAPASNTSAVRHETPARTASAVTTTIASREASAPEPIRKVQGEGLPPGTAVSGTQKTSPHQPTAATQLAEGGPPAPSPTGVRTQPVEAPAPARPAVPEPAPVERQVVEALRMLPRTEGRHEVRMVLNPPELGEVRVRLIVSEGGASVFLGTQTESAREAIQAALPQLREVLQAKNLEPKGLEVTLSNAETGSFGGALDERGHSHDRGADRNDRATWAPAIVAAPATTASRRPAPQASGIDLRA